MNVTRCSQPGCQVDVTGQCLEGFPTPAECPYHKKHVSDDEERHPGEPEESISLPSGEALTDRQAAEVARDHATKVVIIAGPTHSGKTTILTSLFEGFLEAPFANYLFRGSRTLIGFERRCHLAREESGQTVPDTSHTSMREGVVFLHLDLATYDDERLTHTHLLLSDISGELFKRLRNSSNAIEQVPSLARADHFCLALDGEKLIHPEFRHVALNDSRMILRSIVESGALNTRCVIDVAFTKWDIIVGAIESARSESTSFLEDAKIAMERVAGGLEVRFHELAARPSLNAKVPFAHGLPTLLRSWMTRKQPDSKRTVLTAKNRTREFSRFTEAVIIRSRLEDDYDVRRI